MAKDNNNGVKIPLSVEFRLSRLDRVGQVGYFHAVGYCHPAWKSRFSVENNLAHNKIADPIIQGYVEGVFWERNSLSDQKASPTKPTTGETRSLFDV